MIDKKVGWHQDWMNQKIDSLKKLFGEVSTTYESLVSELEETKELSEDQIQKLQDVQSAFDKEMSTYSAEYEFKQMEQRAKDKDQTQVNSVLEVLDQSTRTDLVVRNTQDPKNIVHLIHSFQWKSKLIHIFNLQN